MRRLSRTVALLALLGLLASGCAAPASPSPTTSPSPADSAGGTDESGLPYVLRFVGHEEGQPCVTVDGVGLDGPIDPDRADFGRIQGLFHPVVRVVEGEPRTDLLRGAADSLFTLIYSPILLPSADAWTCLYGGWDMTQERRSGQSRGPTDRLFAIRIPDAGLGDWSAEPEATDRRMVLESDSGPGGDPSLYHINDPSLLDLGDGRLRLYFEMESINAIGTFGAGPAGWTPPAAGEAGIPVHGIAYAESTDGGRTWIGGGGGGTGVVDRRGYLRIEGLSAADYAYHQIGWPSVVRSGGTYLMYFNIFPRRGTDPEEGTLTLSASWADFNNHRISVASPFPADHRFAAGNLHLAVSEDGVDFRYLGEVKDERGGTVHAYNPDVAVLGDGPDALVVYNAQTYAWRSGVPKYPGQWALGVARLDLSDDASRLRLRFLAPGTTGSLDPKTLPFLPSPYQADRSDVAPVWIRKEGRIVGIGFGQWKEPTLDDGWIAAAFLQAHATVRTADGTVVADHDTAIDLDTLQVSAAAVYAPGVAWCVLQGNGRNPEGGKVLEGATLEVRSVDGTLLARKTGLRLVPGDRFEMVGTD